MILLSIIFLFYGLTMVVWLSKRLKMPVVSVSIIGIVTGGLGFVVMYIMALNIDMNEKTVKS